eukprot:1962237-Rhodomonas_salina.2
MAPPLRGSIASTDSLLALSRVFRRRRPRERRGLYQVRDRGGRREGADARPRPDDQALCRGQSAKARPPRVRGASRCVAPRREPGRRFLLSPRGVPAGLREHGDGLPERERAQDHSGSPHLLSHPTSFAMLSVLHSSCLVLSGPVSRRVCPVLTWRMVPQPAPPALAAAIGTVSAADQFKGRNCPQTAIPRTRQAESGIWPVHVSVRSTSGVERSPNPFTSISQPPRFTLPHPHARIPHPRPGASHTQHPLPLAPLSLASRTRTHCTQQTTRQTCAV